MERVDTRTLLLIFCILSALILYFGSCSWIGFTLVNGWDYVMKNFSHGLGGQDMSIPVFLGEVAIDYGIIAIPIVGVPGAAARSIYYMNNPQDMQVEDIWCTLDRFIYLLTHINDDIITGKVDGSDFMSDVNMRYTWYKSIYDGDDLIETETE